MSKFLKLEITRAEGTDVYIEVPDDFDLGRFLPSQLLQAAAVKTTTAGEWDTGLGWEHSLEVQSREIVPAEEAKKFKYIPLAETQKLLT